MTEQEAKRLEVPTEWNGKANVCTYCGRVPETFYVATGHDHTDYDIRWCVCRDGTQYKSEIETLRAKITEKDERIAELETYLKSETKDKESAQESFGTIWSEWQRCEKRIAELEDALKWQTIETAPKDETFLAVMACGDHQQVYTMRWPIAEAKNSRVGNGEFILERVTHWMPLPKPPALNKINEVLS